MLVRRDTHIFEKEQHGHYVEPAWCSQRLLEAEYFGPRGSLILDPACGWGTILRSALDAGFKAAGIDVVDRLQRNELKLDFAQFYKRDFLSEDKFPIWAPIQSIICNPPFDYVREFCERAIDLVESKVAMIMLLRRIPAAHWLNNLPLETIYMLSPRPSMPPGAWIAAGNKPGGGTQDFCFLVFNRQGRRSRYPSVKWLHRDSAT